MSVYETTAEESDASSDEHTNTWVYGVQAADRAEALATVEGDR